MLFYLYVDDIRDNVPLVRIRNLYGVVTLAKAKNYKRAIEWIQAATAEKLNVVLDLDHDLGEGKTGYDICKFIVTNSIPIKHIHLHTSNPVGMQNMEQLLTHYGYKVSRSLASV